jgi:hypothetical protein
MSMVRYNVSVAAKWTYELKAVDGDFVEDSLRAPNQPNRATASPLRAVGASRNDARSRARRSTNAREMGGFRPD